LSCFKVFAILWFSVHDCAIWLACNMCCAIYALRSPVVELFIFVMGSSVEDRASTTQVKCPTGVSGCAACWPPFSWGCVGT
jgi:hypothetical protein